jgi:hypothetical protein
MTDKGRATMRKEAETQYIEKRKKNRRGNI